MTEMAAFDFTGEPLGDVAVRVLGCLLEKEFTTPANYPLSLNALTAACNQTSNREPVMTLDEGVVSEGLQELIRRSLAREVHRSDTRVKRFRHTLQEVLHLHPPELATLCVLLLRGPQTVGEIRGRTGRMVEFVDLSHVEMTLQALATLPVPLAAPLARQPGQKETRYAHALAGEPDLERPVPVMQPPVEPGRLDALEQAVESLRAELAALRAQFEAFRREFQ